MQRTLPMARQGAHWRGAASLSGCRRVGGRRAVPTAGRGELGRRVGDALFTVSLAGSLFFNVSADAARPTVLLYLLLTLAPFAVVGPFVGTVIDRFPGSQRALIATTNLGRTVAMALIAVQLTEPCVLPARVRRARVEQDRIDREELARAVARRRR